MSKTTSSIIRRPSHRRLSKPSAGSSDALPWVALAAGAGLAAWALMRSREAHAASPLPPASLQPPPSNVYPLPAAPAAAPPPFATPTPATPTPAAPRPPAAPKPPSPAVATVADPAPSWPLLASGSQGTQVSSWQRTLVKGGFLPNVASSVDDKFGPHTSAATKLLQGRAGVKADGIVGPDTRKAAVKLGLWTN